MFATLKRWSVAQYTALIQKEHSPKRLAISSCVGIYIAFSPFIGFHTAMVFLFAWAFALNFAVLLAVSCAINNPWTMVPIYAIDYMFGDWVLSFMHINSIEFDPQWVVAINQWVAQSTGIQGVSLCSFLVGGNLLGLGISGILYPILIRIFTKKSR